MIDPNEAPDGYEAREDKMNSCTQCAMLVNTTRGWLCQHPEGSPTCLPYERADKTNVIFIKKVS